MRRLKFKQLCGTFCRQVSDAACCMLVAVLRRCSFLVAQRERSANDATTFRQSAFKRILQSVFVRFIVRRGCTQSANKSKLRRSCMVCNFFQSVGVTGPNGLSILISRIRPLHRIIEHADSGADMRMSIWTAIERICALITEIGKDEMHTVSI